MRREILYNSIKRIIYDIDECGILEFFSLLMGEYRNGSSKGSETSFPIPLILFQKYMLATQSYNEDYIKIMQILDISELLKAQYWEGITTSKSLKELHQMMQSVNFTLTQLPKIMDLAKQDHISDIKEQSSDLPEDLKGKSLLTVLIVEDEGQYSSPLRLTSALEAITNLYSVVALIEKESENDLIVLACDSGSDKSFDFLGIPKIMEEVKEIIIAIWDRRVFHRQRHVSESLALISESLPILERIAQLQDSGSIGREEAELLKRKTITGATQFIEAGATIPELEAVSNHDPKQLMKPEPKLLVSPWSEPNNVNDKDDSKTENEIFEKATPESQSLSVEESEMLKLLLKKSKENKKIKIKSKGPIKNKKRHKSGKD